MTLEEIVEKTHTAEFWDWTTITLDGEDLWLVNGETSAKFRLVND